MQDTNVTNIQTEHLQNSLRGLNTTNSKQNTNNTVHEALKQQILKQNTYKTVRETLT